MAVLPWSSCWDRRSVCVVCQPAAIWRALTDHGNRWSVPPQWVRINITSMKPLKTCFVYLLCYWLAAPLAFSADSGPLRGYSTEAARAGRDWEGRVRAMDGPG